MFDDLNSTDKEKDNNASTPASPAPPPPPSPARSTPDTAPPADINEPATAASPQPATPLAADAPGGATQARESNKLEDIFSNSEPGGAVPTPPPKPAVFTPKAEPAPPSQPTPGGEEKKKKRKIIPVLMLSGFMVLAAGGYLGYRFLVAQVKEDKAPEVSDVITPPSIPSNESADTPTSPTPEPIPTAEPESQIDSDNDGLTDREEIILGTKINSKDSDSDGLYDREEVRVYKTNPLNPDTDGDGFLDGIEVDKGYNPKGEGKLYEIN